MNGLKGAQSNRLIAVMRALAELLDNCADGLVSSVLATTALLLAIMALHALADALENGPDVLALFLTHFGRS
ncbi:hypothetical protein AB0I81_38835 [Nonomuraea sp. NPDC050404]|uniref:hypothetical protein n=1 Tax=Nonomuraea sp. NPDC050404 TaxID=3155783 RepID=UPI0033C08CCB